MLRRSLLLAWLVAILGILAPCVASAATTTRLETRVRDFELVVPTLIGRSTARTPEKHPENSNAYDEIASSSPLAAEGVGATAQGVASDARLFQAYRAELAAQEIQGADAVGSALKSDAYHRSASFVTDTIAAHGKVFSLGNRTGTVNLSQVLGEMNGVSGRFEWIVDGSGNLTHQMFVGGGRVTGVPVAP